jgi:hypothetical protein
MTITHYPEVVAISPQANAITFGGATTDAFGRLRVSEPFTFFDSQHRYKDNGYFDTAVVGGGSATHLTNESTVRMDVGTASGDSVIRQSKRCFPYQSGKSLLIFNSFMMNQAKANVRQRIGSFNSNNGVFLEQNGTALPSFVVRSFATGSAVDNKVLQSSWNVDKFDGTGISGITLDLTKVHILYIDIEWLGVGSVRCGFVIDGTLHICHKFNHANSITSVYMTTASLPVRIELTNTGISASASSLKQICSSVMSESGYERKVAQSIARKTVNTSITTSFIPIVSIKLASDRLDAVILPSRFIGFPTSTGDFEVVLIRNATLTGASYDTTTFNNVDFDIAATALSGGTIISSIFTSATNQSASAAANNTEYNWDLQLGSTLAGVSDVITLAARTFTGTNTMVGALEFFDLT